ncbi:MAG: Fic family protein [Chloroflexi bacterium]|nr:Fic family protein [Chloroflexota bacterium]
MFLHQRQFSGNHCLGLLSRSFDVRNHPFMDGNKRTGAVASVVFLMMNGIEPRAGGDTLRRWFVQWQKG